MNTTTANLAFPSTQVWSYDQPKKAQLPFPTILLMIVCSAAFLKAIQQASLWTYRRFRSWAYLLKGIDIVQNEFSKASGKPFEVYAPDNRYVYVSSSKHINELDQAPDSVLSMEAATKQMLQPQYTMNGFNWFDHRGTEGVGFIKALRTMLTNKLPQLLPDLTTIVKFRVSELFAENPSKGGSKEISAYPLVLKLVVLTNAVSFFGKPLAKNEAFMTSALDHIEQTLVCAEVVRLAPKTLAPLIGKYMAMRLRAHETIFDTLLPVAQERCLERDQRLLGHQVPTHSDCIQWILDASPRQKPWTAERVVHEIIAIWFGSVHAVSATITFAIHDLCMHPEYLQPLRQELIDGYSNFEHMAAELPLLDSFIKESARLTPIESQSTRRAALKPFQFSDGTTVNVGDWACTPARAIMQCTEHYPEPLQFHGFRFVDETTLNRLCAADVNDSARQNAPAKLTDVDDTWLIWGTGRMKCPGRFYAAAVMKVILGQIILNYDCKLVGDTSPRFTTWRTTTIPTHKTKVAFTPCESEAL